MNTLEEKYVIIIQKFVRRYLIRKKILIPSSYYQTKIWRQNRKWYKNGKSNECEKYQISLIEKIIKQKINKTFDRINFETHEIKNIKQPLKDNDGFEWTENFDGKVLHENNIIYFNLKFVSENGGAQTRTLREVYHFINCQIKHIIKFNSHNVIFVNILDGNTSFQHQSKYHYLSTKQQINISKNFFIGDLSTFQKQKVRIF